MRKPMVTVDTSSSMRDTKTMSTRSDNIDVDQATRGEHQPARRMALTALAISVGLLLAVAIWLAIERAPALLLDLAKMPWCL